MNFLHQARYVAAICAVAAAFFLFAGCSGNSSSRAAVSGRVTLGGQPLGHGRILFIATGPNGGLVASAVIVDGRYSFEHADGPRCGANRVEVEATSRPGPAVDDESAFPSHALAASSQSATTLVSDVSNPSNSISQPSYEVRPGENVYDLDLPHPTRWTP